MHSWLWIFVGGGAGCLCRHAVGTYFAEAGTSFPWGTLIANLLACIILGAVIGYEVKMDISPTAKLLLATGFCGGFSTFSTYSLETLKMLQSGEWLAASTYIVGSIVLGLLAVLLGAKLINVLG